MEAGSAREKMVWGGAYWGGAIRGAGPIGAGADGCMGELGLWVRGAVGRSPGSRGLHSLMPPSQQWALCLPVPLSLPVPHSWPWGRVPACTPEHPGQRARPPG